MQGAEGLISGRKGEGGFGVGEGGIIGVDGESGGAAGEEEDCGNDSGTSYFESLVVASRMMGVSWVCVLDFGMLMLVWVPEENVKLRARVGWKR